MSAPTLKTILGQPSWSFGSTHVQAHLTPLGGHLGPMEFRLGRRTVSPMSVAPWAEETAAAELIPVLRALRGDLFCAPFGGNDTPWRGESHLLHGETANATWRLERIGHAAEGRTTLHARLDAKIRGFRADKYVTLVDGQTMVYQRHVLTGGRGPMPVGHHAMLKFPDEPGSGLVGTSRFVRGQVFPDAFERPDQRGYQALKPGATFRSLDRVPLLVGGYTDVSRYPARKGYEDLVMLTADGKLPLAWTAVTFPRERYMWFALRDPQVLRHTILWLSNGGRHYPPWSGRHTSVLGLEDTTSYFHYGLAESAKPNPLSRRGIPTAVTLEPRSPTVVNYIFGVAAIPAGFDRVRDIRPAAAGVELVSASGKRVRTAVDLAFLQG